MTLEGPVTVWNLTTLCSEVGSVASIPPPSFALVLPLAIPLQALVGTSSETSSGGVMEVYARVGAVYAWVVN